MIEIVFLTNAVISLIALQIGIFLKVWTPKRLLWYPLLCFIPFDIAVVIQMIIDNKYFSIIPILIVLAAVNFGFGFILKNEMSREPWKSWYHVRMDGEKRKEKM